MQEPKESDMLISTDRLFLREMEQSDFSALSLILQDKDVMTAYEKTFSDEEVQAWLDKQLERYRKDGFGLWAVILKETGEMIGQCGLTLQEYNGAEVLEIGYLFQKAYWHHGYATEAAGACRDYAFKVLGASEVYSLIKETNTASRKVAERNGMTVSGTFSKKYRYYEDERHHLAYSVKNPNAALDTGPFYHGTKADLKPGDLLKPNFDSNYGERKKANFIYLTATLDAAKWGAELAVGEEPGRIYQVEPTGMIENDPNLTDKKFPGNPTRSYRTRQPLKVVGEVLDWEGHPPEVLKNMLDHLAELKRLGIEAINE